MNKFPDEVILQARKSQDIEFISDQIELEDSLPEEYLQTVEMGERSISIKIPAFLQDMPLELRELKYQYEPSPQIVKTTASGEINFTFSLLDLSVRPEQLETIVKACKKAWRRVMPNLLFYEEREEIIHGITVRWMEFANLSGGSRIYNLLFYAAAERVLVGSMNCPYHKHDTWIKVAKMCMRTLRGKEDDKETTGTLRERELDQSGERTAGTYIYESVAGASKEL